MDLSLLFEDNRTGHDDLVLRFGGQSYVCDTYYLALDSKLLPESEYTNHVRVVLQKIFEQWLSVVENLQDGGSVYLPYDFSDQYTGWLCCSRSGNTASVCRGWATVEGWSISPSAVGQYMTLLPEFRPDGPTVQVPIKELIEAIQNSIFQITCPGNGVSVTERNQSGPSTF